MASKFMDRLIKASGNSLASVVTTSEFCHIDKFTSTEIPLFNALLSATMYGGYPEGVVTQLAGKPGSGKTRLAIVGAQMFLKNNPNGLIIWVDTEHAVREELFTSNDINPEQVMYVPVSIAEELATQCKGILDSYVAARREYKKGLEEFEKASRVAANKKKKKGDVEEVAEPLVFDMEEPPPVYMVIDSVGNLTSVKEATDMTEGNDKRDMTRQQKMKAFFRVNTMLFAEAKFTVVALNHVYAKIGSVGNEIAGGSGVAFASSITIMLSKGKDSEGSGEDRVQIGAKIYASIVKSRFAMEGKTVKLYLSFKKGFHPYYGLLPFAIKAGCIEKDGTKYYVPHLDKKLWEKELYNPEVFTPDVMAKVELEVKEFFEYGKIDPNQDVNADFVMEEEG